MQRNFVLESIGREVEIELPGPEEPKPPYGRTAHPYFLHDMIRSQPRAIGATVRESLRQARSIPAPPVGKPLLFVGMGTSFHAAIASARGAEAAFGPGTPCRAVDAFELLLEPNRISGAGRAVVFSSSGETALTLRAQEALRAGGVPQTLITGTARSRSVELADHVVLTHHATEEAWVHTVSYTTAIAAALALEREWAGRSVTDLASVDAGVAHVVDRETDWKRLSEELRKCPKLLCLGSGFAEATAREAALKLREGAARFVAWTGVEEFLHGVLPSVGPGTAVLAVSTSPLEQRRAETAVRAAEKAGATTAWFHRGPPRSSPGEFELPAATGPLTPIVDIVPFQFLAYWIAVGEGRNPDVMGFDDPRIFAARRTYGI